MWAASPPPSPVGFLWGKGPLPALDLKQKIHMTQKDPETFLLTKWFIGGLWYQGQKPHSLAALGGEAETLHICSETVWLFDLGTRGLHKITWPKNPFGIPSGFTTVLIRFNKVSNGFNEV